MTHCDIAEFVKIATATVGEVKLVNDNGFCVNGKSLLGVMAAVKWESLYCVSESDIYSDIQRFCEERGVTSGSDE